MKISIQSIMEAGCDHIWHPLLLAGTMAGDVLTIEDHVAQPIIDKCHGTLTFLTEPQLIRHQVNITVRGHDSQPTVKISALQYDQWPMALRLFVGATKNPDDTGLGDIVERLIIPLGADKFKEWHLLIFGRECGCGQRKDFLNQRYPLKIIDNQPQSTNVNP